MNKRIISISILLSPIFIAALALFWGAYDISPSQVIRAIWNSVALSQKQTEVDIVMNIRLPRILLSGLVGIALSGSGVTLQGIFKNPLVDPFILGISAGAAFGCAIAIGFMEWLPVPLSSFAFGLLSVFLAYSLAKTQGEVSRLPLVLSGIVVSAFFTALVSIIKFLVDPHRLQSIVFWIMGSFALADWDGVVSLFIGLCIAMIPMFAMRWRLNPLSMGDEEASSLGIDVKKERLLFIALSSLGVCLCVAKAGIIGWTGLMVPHLARMLVGPDHKLLMPVAMAGGASFMILCDTIARSITSYDLPVGIISASLGAPFFMYLMKKGGKEAWGN